MAPISGTYRLVSSDNKLGDCEATFSGVMSPEDIRLLAAPENQWTMIIKETEKGIIFTVEYSQTPQFNGTYEYVYGGKTTFAGYPGSSVLTKVGDSAITEVWTDAEGATSRSYSIKMDNFGAVLRTSTPAAGVIATSVYERVNVPDLCGFYLLESHENVGAVMAQLTKDQLDQMLSYCAFRITKSKDDVYTATDYFGAGFPEKKTVFRFGEQQDQGPLEEFGMSDVVLLVTRLGPTKISYLLKDRDSGRTQAWIGEATADSFIWTVEAAAGVTTRMTYRRVGDIMGDWRMVVGDENEAYLDALGLPAGPLRDQIKAERPKIRFAHLGAGVWEYTSEQKSVPHAPIVGRFGEQWTVDMGQLGPMSMVWNFTRDGMVGSEKIGDKVLAAKWTVLKDFATMEASVAGVPGTTVCSIFIRA